MACKLGNVFECCEDKCCIECDSLETCCIECDFLDSVEFAEDCRFYVKGDEK